VKEVAEAKRFSMNKLSQRSEVSYHIIRDIYRDPFKTVNTDTINRLAQALGVPTTDLLEDVPAPDTRTEK
jgi:DNA-binding Xre family transcriptional regulator